MPKLPQVKSRDLVKVALIMGFVFRDQSGSHAVYVHSDGRRVSIPIHPSETLGVGLLVKIIKKDMQITKEEFLDFLKR